MPIALLVTIWLVDQLRSRAVPVWIDVGHSLEASLLYLGPIIASATAFQTVREGRGALRELLDSMPRADSMRSLALISGELIWCATVYLVVTVWMLIVTGIRATSGGPDIELIVAGFIGLMAFASLGFLAGRLLPAYSVVPLVGLITYLGVWLTGVGETPIRLLSPLIDGEPSPLLPFPPSVGLLQSLWLLGLAGVAFGMGTLWREGSRNGVILTTIAGMISLIAALLLVTEGEVFANSVGIHYEAACRSNSDVTTCIHPAYGVVVDQAAAIAAETVRPLNQATGWPTRMLQVGLRSDAQRIEELDSTTLGFTTSPVGSHGFERDGFVQGIAFASVGFDKCDDLNPDDPVRIGLAIWLVNEAIPDSIPITGLPMAEWLDGQTTTSREVWLRENLRSLRGCAEVDLPAAG
jgi:hypothetical protein